MLTFDVQDMSCGHCASTIAKAVHALDARAVVRIDLTTHRVEVEPDRAEPADIARAIEDAGYTPVAA